MWSARSSVVYKMVIASPVSRTVSSTEMAIYVPLMRAWVCVVRTITAVAAVGLSSSSSSMPSRGFIKKVSSPDLADAPWTATCYLSLVIVVHTVLLSVGFMYI